VADKQLASSGLFSETAQASGVSMIVFMLFVVAGSAYIVLAKLAGIGPVFVTFVPVAFMLG
jgi:hypothetical protein